MSALLNRLRREESGMTLVELLVASVLSIIVLGAAFQILIIGMKGTQRISAGIDTVQRGRQAMENVTRELRSQICLPTASGPQPAILSGDGTTVNFYADLGDESLTPELRSISFASSQITEKIYANTGTATNPAFAGYPNSPTRTRVLTTNISQIDASTPYIRYYSFSTSDPIEPSVLLNTPLNDTDRARVVQLNISFVSNPTGPNADPKSRTVMDNKVFVRTSSAQDPERSPACL
jgi:type II secretory pathway pseudopilin PulG